MKETVASVGEVGVIRRLSRRLAHPASVLVGIGDDTAVLRLPAGQRGARAGGKGASRLLFASDMLIEGVHFRLPRHRRGRGDLAPRWIGWKALASNISDVAAMGGVPNYAVVSLGLPRRTPLRVVDQLYDGLAQCARRFGVAIVGGDTVRAPCVVVDVAMVGTLKATTQPVVRSGGRVGDRLFVTGRLGGSWASQRHATFLPRLREAQWLVHHVPVHAMIDLSDGLASDLWRVAEASRVTIQIRERAIPVSKAATTCRHRACGGHAWRGRNAVWHALMDGEDFELAFLIPRRMAGRVPRSIGRTPVTGIGVVTKRGVGVELMRRNGSITPLIPEGFRHF